MITGYDHVQVAIPADGEDRARAYYSALIGMREVPKPAALAARGGCWFASGTAVLHLGVERPFQPARSAHPAFVVDDLDRLAASLRAAGYDVRSADGELPAIRRIHTFDPFGNRLEFQQAPAA
ncbi:MAG: VOC family protein [Actinomycetota bacterium]